MLPDPLTDLLRPRLPYPLCPVRECPSCLAPGAFAMLVTGRTGHAFTTIQVAFLYFMLDLVTAPSIVIDDLIAHIGAELRSKDEMWMFW